MRITEKEMAVLRSIYDSEYQDGDKEDTIDKAVWTFSVDPPAGCPRSTLSGVVSSLVRKGLAGSMGGGHQDDTLWLTEKGYRALDAVGGTVRDISAERS